MNYFYTLVQNNNRIIIELILRFARKLILILEIDHQDFHRKLFNYNNTNYYLIS